MKNSLILSIFLFLGNLSFAQSKIEPSLSGGVGYITDNTGNGNYEYTTGTISYKKTNRLYGGFIGFTNVAVVFSGYHFTAKEYTIGPSLIGWGKFSKNFDYCFWAMPGFKIFRDQGQAALSTEIVKQNDLGTYSIFGANITDAKNRWFRNYKIQIQYQKNFWSKRIGWNGSGNIVDGVNYKAVNKAYFKSQFEVAAKRFNLGKRGRLEPKVVFGHLYDWGPQKSYLEFGSGVAISFTKNSRYYEPCNIQQRIRYGLEFGHSLSVLEFNLDLVATYNLIMN
jgi:hypothetical protein